MWLKFLLGLFFCLGFYWFSKVQKQDNAKPSVLKPPNVEVPLPPSRSLLHVFGKAAVCSDKADCSKIGKNILQLKGNAIDATIATLLCNGLVTMQSMGLGGGVIMTFYESKTKKGITINGRERASLNIRYEYLKHLEKTYPFAKSALSIAVPGELAAYHEAHRLYGSLAWSDIIQPTVNLCQRGYLLTRHQHDALYLNEDMIRKDKLLSQMFVDSATDAFYKEGWHIKFPKQICNTYKLLAEEGALTFYNGSLASLIVKDLNDMGSPITIDDFRLYQPSIEDAFKVDLDPFYIFLPRPPGSGHVVGFILKLLQYFKKDFSLTKDFNSTAIHRIVEALKFGFVKRWVIDADVDNLTLQNLFNKDILDNLALLIDDSKTFNDVQHYGAKDSLTSIQDYGTAQISVLAPNGDAVSATSSINYYFGSGRMGQRSGILFNNAICDFTIENFENYFNLPNLKNVNKLEAQKQPMSSMSPLIVTNKQTGHVRLVVGAAGGSRIISTLVQILIRILWQQQNIKQAIDAARFHHQLSPNLLEYEFGMLQHVIEDLENRGHRTERVRQKSTAVCGLERIKKEFILANADYRKEGAVDGF